jgi:hypothetical protein
MERGGRAINKETLLQRSGRGEKKCAQAEWSAWCDRREQRTPGIALRAGGTSRRQSDGTDNVPTNTGLVSGTAHAAILYKAVLPRETHQPQSGFLGN